jgi:hypothetical protein
VSLIFKEIGLFDYIERLMQINYGQVKDHFNRFFENYQSSVSIILPN